MTSLDGKVVIITGASSGIGEGIARHMATLGARLSLFGRRADKLERVAQACRENGTAQTEVLVVAGDVCNSEDRKRLINQTIDRYGKLNVLVNNAGILRYKTVCNTSEEDYDTVFDTNVKSQVFLTQLAIPYLKETKGNIVNNASYVGTQATPEIGMYGMTKAAMNMFTKCLAMDLAPFGVRANSINPGVIDTEIFGMAGEELKEDAEYRKFLDRTKLVHPLQRTGVPQDCAEAVAFLASDAASFITSSHLHVDGGKHCMGTGLNFYT